jgi:hypothetical protein
MMVLDLHAMHVLQLTQVLTTTGPKTVTPKTVTASQES